MALRTERLLLRRPTPADEGMQHHVRQWERNGIGKLAVVRRADGAVLGRVGIQLLDPVTGDPVEGSEGQAELGWTLRPEHWGHGDAAEAARAVPPAVDLPDGPHVIWEHASVKIGSR